MLLQPSPSNGNMISYVLVLIVFRSVFNSSAKCYRENSPETKLNQKALCNAFHTRLKYFPCINSRHCDTRVSSPLSLFQLEKPSSVYFINSGCETTEAAKNHVRINSKNQLFSGLLSRSMIEYCSTSL